MSDDGHNGREDVYDGMQMLLSLLAPRDDLCTELAENEGHGRLYGSCSKTHGTRQTECGSVEMTPGAAVSIIASTSGVSATSETAVVVATVGDFDN